MFINNHINKTINQVNIYYPQQDQLSFLFHYYGPWQFKPKHSTSKVLFNRDLRTQDGRDKPKMAAILDTREDTGSETDDSNPHCYRAFFSRDVTAAMLVSS